jgi:hypothetical protein
MNNSTIEHLNKYFLNNENIYSIIEKMDSFLKKKKEPKKPQKDELKNVNNVFINNFFIPSELYEDTLFWCWIIFNEGLSSYSFAENYIFKIKNQKKIELIQLLRDNKVLLKKHKIKICDIENNLLYEQRISLNTLRSILLVHSYNLVYITNTMYFESFDFYDNKTCYIYKNKDRYGLWISNKTPDLHSIKLKRMVIDKINKPLYSLSHYKIIELKEICNKLNINIMNNNNKSKKKKELYDLIIQTIF